MQISDISQQTCLCLGNTLLCLFALPLEFAHQLVKMSADQVVGPSCALDCLDRHVSSTGLVQQHHLERRGNRAFFIVTCNRNSVQVGPPKQQALQLVCTILEVGVGTSEVKRTSNALSDPARGAAGRAEDHKIGHTGGAYQSI